ncbi:MAG: CxxC-x17-CxxC domain-containing protein [Patescibacteria group bacterium]
MTAFNKRGGGNRFGGGGRPRFNGPGSGHSDGHKKSWGDNRSGDGPVTMHQAICSNCGNTCEVPFRPVEGKPVYCKDCFSKKGGSTDGERFQKRDTRQYSSANPHPRDLVNPHPQGAVQTSFESTRGHEDIKKQLQTVNVKLDRLIQVLEHMSAGVLARSVAEKVSLSKTSGTTKKTVAKKDTKKKGKK